MPNQQKLALAQAQEETSLAVVAEVAAVEEAVEAEEAGEHATAVAPRAVEEAGEAKTQAEEQVETSAAAPLPIKSDDTSSVAALDTATASMVVA